MEAKDRDSFENALSSDVLDGVRIVCANCCFYFHTIRDVDERLNGDCTVVQFNILLPRFQKHKSRKRSQSAVRDQVGRVFCLRQPFTAYLRTNLIDPQRNNVVWGWKSILLTATLSQKINFIKWKVLFFVQNKQFSVNWTLLALSARLGAKYCFHRREIYTYCCNKNACIWRYIDCRSSKLLHRIFREHLKVKLENKI